jgi:hypothetical protein
VQSKSYTLADEASAVSEWYQLGLLRSVLASLYLDRTLSKSLLADGNAERDANEIGILELYTGALLSVVD